MRTRSTTTPRVEYVLGFESADGTVTLGGIRGRIPSHGNDYIDEMYERTRQTYEWGAKNGKLRKVLAIEKATIGKVAVIRSELISMSGSRDTVIAYHFPEAPSHGGVLTVSVTEGVSQERREEVEKLLADSSCSHRNRPNHYRSRQTIRLDPCSIYAGSV